jgi:type IV pilus assembly protein PilF
MSWDIGAVKRLAGTGAMVAILAFIAACTTTSTTSTGGVPTSNVSGDGGSSRASGDSKDRVTASDEPDSAKRARVRMELASAYFGRGQMTTALDEVKLAIAADPNMVAAFNLRGLIYASLGDERLAEESFRHALQLDARDADTMQNYGWYLCQQKRFSEADTLFRQALAVPQYRDVPRTLLTQGICQARAGELAQAEGTLTKSYEIDPANPATAVNLAEVLFRRGEFERARFYVRRVNNNTNLSNAQTLWLAARIEQRLGNRQGAQDLGTQIKNRFPQSREAVAFEQGKFDE